MYPEMAYSFPRLYLASGVTTARTAGSIEPYTDLNIKKLIDGGRMPGPKLYVTGPYLEGKGAFTPQMHELTRTPTTPPGPSTTGPTRASPRSRPT